MRKVQPHIEMNRIIKKIKNKLKKKIYNKNWINRRSKIKSWQNKICNSSKK